MADDEDEDGVQYGWTSVEIWGPLALRGTGHRPVRLVLPDRRGLEQDIAYLVETWAREIAHIYALKDTRGNITYEDPRLRVQLRVWLDGGESDEQHQGE